MALFSLNNTRSQDDRITYWFGEHDDVLGRIAHQWYSAIRACGDDVLEVLHEGYPVLCIEEFPFAYVNAFTSHVNVGLFYGAFLDDPARILEGSGKRMRHVKIKPGHEPDEDGLKALIDAAYLDIKARIVAEGS